MPAWLKPGRVPDVDILLFAGKVFGAVVVVCLIGAAVCHFTTSAGRRDDPSESEGA